MTQKTIQETVSQSMKLYQEYFSEIMINELRCHPFNFHLQVGDLIGLRRKYERLLLGCVGAGASGSKPASLLPAWLLINKPVLPLKQ